MSVVSSMLLLSGSHPSTRTDLLTNRGRHAATSSATVRPQTPDCGNDCDRVRALMGCVRGLHSQAAVHIVFHTGTLIMDGSPALCVV